ncbi:MAG: N-acetylglucosamine-6-phosphate deacetylase [Anaerolineae bacterium]|nr:N-acetylglucosamine-6-phosphate deacetylase [Anaerolineae bacterium]
MLAIIHGTVYTPTRIIPDGRVLIEGAHIRAVGSPSQVPLPEGVEQIDAQGHIVCPGLVDIHVHGGDGADATDGNAAAIQRLAGRHLRAGTTSLVPTTASAPLAQIWRSFDAIREVKAAQGERMTGDQARVLGIHMEGPFFSLEQRGAHAPELLRMPDDAEREKLYSYSEDLACVTLAPEREGALVLIRELARRGVLVAGGHSDALYAQVCLAMHAGLSHVVHLWSGMSTVRRIGPKRHAGMLEAALVEEGLTGEIIADGYHLPTSLMRMAYRLKGPEKLCLVSDAMRASGMGPGEYDVAGQRALVEDGGGVAITPDRKAFAGSISTMLQCLQHIVHVVGISLRDGLQMATLTPARIHGWEDRIGQLARGRYADLLILDSATLVPRLIMLAGRQARTSETQ